MQIARKHLIEALERVERAARRTGAIATITAKPTTAEFEGGGSEVRVHVTTPADTSAPWEASVPTGPLRDVARNLSSDTLSLSLAGSQLVVEGDGLRGAINTTVAPDEPAVLYPTEHRIAMPAREFAAGVNRVAYASAPPNSPSLVFTGAHLHISGERMALVATDGYRLSRAFVTAQRGVDDATALVPARALQDLARVCDAAGDAPLQLSIGRDDATPVLYAHVGDYRTRIALLDGVFPDWQRVIPQTFVTTVTIDVARLTDAIKRVSIFGDPKQAHKVVLELASGAAQVSADGPAGQAVQGLKPRLHDGAPLTIEVNSSYLLQALDSMSGEVEARFSGPTTAFTLAPAEGIDVMAMVVPLRTGA